MDEPLNYWFLATLVAAANPYSLSCRIFSTIIHNSLVLVPDTFRHGGSIPVLLRTTPIMGRPPTTEEHKRIKKRARQQRYRAKKRATLKQDTGQDSSSAHTTAVPIQRDPVPMYYTLATTYHWRDHSDPTHSTAKLDRCSSSSNSKTTAFELYSDHCRMAGDLVLPACLPVLVMRSSVNRLQELLPNKDASSGSRPPQTVVS